MYVVDSGQYAVQQRLASLEGCKRLALSEVLASHTSLGRSVDDDDTLLVRLSTAED
jgi:hypothetical protein